MSKNNQIKSPQRFPRIRLATLDTVRVVKRRKASRTPPTGHELIVNSVKTNSPLGFEGEKGEKKREEATSSQLGCITD